MTRPHTVAVLSAKASHEARLRTRLAELVAPSRQEPGIAFRFRDWNAVEKADAYRLTQIA
ncbi:hypothetical protein DIE14_34260 [Burkholderia sp. Bp9017]|uniref:Uncharacterized protein n=1 Tax=Burkholderia anthina TaxID=179879 RepID=A0A7T6VH73_9BURK|nr:MULTISPECIES: hypothetical protein [Burkholderia]MBY4866070.1 hypothetical protein [Burkholderia anthina]QQK03874.1 hypothetical protein JFN94_06860 [Burkholderia anthina]RQZ14316.1 hypothetical protein DIE14_34260 [Burkholderia sp. Bp9017]RQZ25879.1 hypothetical protein DIE13_31275 [Burkholderia sp. Bp9016]